jgi:hypothetical protein
LRLLGPERDEKSRRKPRMHRCSSAERHRWAVLEFACGVAPDFRRGRVGSEPGIRRPAPDREPVTRWPVPLPSLAKPAILARRVRDQMVRAGSYEAEIDAARRERPRRLRWQARGPRRAPKCSRGAGRSPAGHRRWTFASKTPANRDWLSALYHVGWRIWPGIGMGTANPQARTCRTAWWWCPPPCSRGRGCCRGPW